MSEDTDYERRFDRKVDNRKSRRWDDNNRKTMDEVFDQRTLRLLNKMLSNKLISSVEHPVATGKEGKVFLARDKDGNPLAMKVYRMSNATFKTIAKYIVGDPRFAGLEKNRDKTIYTWATKEFKNLSRLHSNGLSVPRPVTSRKNIVLMGFIGDENGAAPMLRQTIVDEPEELFEKLSTYLVRQHNEAKLVHGDLSEYNILMNGQEPVVIDVGQAVTVDHPMAPEWLMRDVKNICRYFNDLGVETDPKALFHRIIKEGS